MKQIITNILQLAFYTLLLAVPGACNKEAGSTKAVSIEIRGFNIGNAELELSIDTLVYRNEKASPNKELYFGNVYTYPSSKQEAVLKIKDLTSGKEIYQQSIGLNNDDMERFIPFVLIDGQQLEINPPAPDTTTNKVGFYIHYPASNDPIDVFMKNDEGQMVYLVKNVLPSTWVYGNYVAAEGFLNPNTNYRVCFAKAGTTDSWAFQDSEYMSFSYEDAMFLPQKDEKGRVCYYFITPGTADLRAVRLFKQPK